LISHGGSREWEEEEEEDFPLQQEDWNRIGLPYGRYAYYKYSDETTAPVY